MTLPIPPEKSRARKESKGSFREFSQSGKALSIRARVGITPRDG